MKWSKVVLEDCKTKAQLKALEKRDLNDTAQLEENKQFTVAVKGNNIKFEFERSLPGILGRIMYFVDYAGRNSEVTARDTPNKVDLLIKKETVERREIEEIFEIIYNVFDGRRYTETSFESGGLKV